MDRTVIIFLFTGMELLKLFVSEFYGIETDERLFEYYDTTKMEFFR